VLLDMSLFLTDRQICSKDGPFESVAASHTLGRVPLLPSTSLVTSLPTNGKHCGKHLAAGRLVLLGIVIPLGRSLKFTIIFRINF
jgi:hypothetical protein